MPDLLPPLHHHHPRTPTTPEVKLKRPLKCWFCFNTWQSILSNEGEARQLHERICHKLVIVTYFKQYFSMLQSVNSTMRNKNIQKIDRLSSTFCSWMVEEHRLIQLFSFPGCEEVLIMKTTNSLSVEQSAIHRLSLTFCSSGRWQSLSWVNVRLTAEGGHVVVAGEDCQGSGGKSMKGYFRSCWSCSRPINQ